MSSLLYVICGSIVGSLFHKLSKYDGSDSADVPKLVLTALMGIFWPATGPAAVCYMLVSKLVDKFTKV